MDELRMIDVINLLGIPKPQKSSGYEYQVKCPVCGTEKNSRKTLYINLKEDVFHCFKCNCAGRTTGLYLLFKGMDDTPENRKLAYKNITEGVRSPFYTKPQKPENIIQTEIASVDVRHKTYSTLLSYLNLEPNHRQNLLNRGITNDDIEHLGYKSLSAKSPKDIYKKLLDAGCVLEGVPGFYKDGDNNWAIADVTSSGILIPFKNIEGKITGLQKRLDVTTKGKFRWFSSSSYNYGTKAENAIHIVGSPNTPLVIVTEGGMKADIINLLSNKTVVAVSGVNSIKGLQNLIEDLRDNHGLSVLKLAFDMDFLTNEQVEKAYNSLVSMVESTGVKYHKLVWDPAYKGLDDFLKHIKDTKQCKLVGDKQVKNKST